MIRTPFEALDLAIHCTLIDSRIRPAQPGDMIAHLNEETRQLLRQLTSDDARRVREDYARLWIPKPGYCQHGRFYRECCKACGR